MSEETPTQENTPKKENNAGKCGMGAFDVVKKANVGKKLFLHLPDGTPTEEYLIVLGADGKKFKKALSKYQSDRVHLSNQLKNKNMSRGRYEAALEENEITLIASLVADWSFAAECSKENVFNFLENSPQVREAVNTFAGDRTNFFEKPVKDSEPTQ